MARHWLIASTKQRWECSLHPGHWTRAQVQGLDGDFGTYAVHPQHSGHLVNRFGWSSAFDSPRRQPPDQLLLEGQ
jgi:hypothetical protein